MQKVVLALGSVSDGTGLARPEEDAAALRGLEQALRPIRAVYHEIVGQMPVTHVGDRTLSARGFVELWFVPECIEGGLGALNACLDEDLVRLLPYRWFTIEENVVIDRAGRPGGFIRYSPIRRRSTLSPEEFQRYWFNVHSTFTKRVPGVQRYTQNFVTGTGVPAGLPAAIPVVDGFVEISFSGRTDMEAAYASPEAFEMFEDAKNFLDAVSTYLVEPRAVA